MESIQTVYYTAEVKHTWHVTQHSKGRTRGKTVESTSTTNVVLSVRTANAAA
jgi:hypothetical protein